jgi:uncharacterized protein YmfQ (DUF2313 family)
MTSQECVVQARMDPTLVREYRARWEAVSAIEDAERQRATLEERWAKLNALLRMAAALGVDLHAGREDEAVVRQRWVKLKAGAV